MVLLAFLPKDRAHGHVAPREYLLQAPVLIELDVRRGEILARAEFVNAPPGEGTIPFRLRANRDMFLEGRELGRSEEMRHKRDEVTTELLDELLDEEISVVEWRFPLNILPEVIEVVPQVHERTVFQARHEGLAVNQLDFLVAAEELLLDWTDPWHTHFRNPRLRRAFHKPAMLYLVEEEDTVRFEAALRVVDVLGLEDTTGSWNAEQRKELAAQVAAQAKARAVFEADGEALEMKLLTSVLVERSLKGATLVEDNAGVKALTGTVALVFVADQPPAGATRRFRWTLFDKRIWQVPVVVRGRHGFSTQAELTEERNKIEWQGAKPFEPPRPVLPIPPPDAPSRWPLLAIATALALAGSFLTASRVICSQKHFSDI